jgi:hypothetical protein
VGERDSSPKQILLKNDLSGRKPDIRQNTEFKILDLEKKY